MHSVDVHARAPRRFALRAAAARNVPRMQYLEYSYCPSQRHCECPATHAHTCVRSREHTSQEMVNVAYASISFGEGEAHLAVPMARARIIAHAIDENTNHRGIPYKVRSPCVATMHTRARLCGVARSTRRRHTAPSVGTVWYTTVTRAIKVGSAGLVRVGYLGRTSCSPSHTATRSRRTSCSPQSSPRSGRC